MGDNYRVNELEQKHNMVFISHANPEDDHFALWLSLKLANCGYPVWCDKTKLLGGEIFWDDIEEAIRNRTQKFLYVLSKTSNHKLGALDELKLALTIERHESLKDFVIPLWIDDLKSKDFHIMLQRRNAIPFNRSWAEGLQQLLTKLDDDNVLKDPRFTPSTVNTWWEANTLTDCAIIDNSEEYLSNLFPITSLPSMIYLHSLQTSYLNILKRNILPYPYRRNGNYLISFANIDKLTNSTFLQHSIIDSKQINTNDFLSGTTVPLTIKTSDAHNIVISLIRKSWENMAWLKLRLHKISKYKKAVYFPNNYLKSNRVKSPFDFSSSRDIVGCRNARDNEGNIIKTTYWHFALEAKPIVSPYLAFYMIPRVLFSNDGKTIWEGNLRNNRARRTYCKNWWNREWRDRTLGMMHWLSEKEACIKLSLGSEKDVEVSTTPISILSPITYIEPKEEPKQEFEVDLDSDLFTGDMD